MRAGGRGMHLWLGHLRVELRKWKECPVLSTLARDFKSETRLNYINVDYIYQNAQQRLFILGNVRSFKVRKGSLESVYRSLIQSIKFWYCDIVWISDSQKPSKIGSSPRPGRKKSLAQNTENQLFHLYHHSVKIK